MVKLVDENTANLITNTGLLVALGGQAAVVGTTIGTITGGIAPYGFLAVVVGTVLHIANRVTK